MKKLILYCLSFCFLPLVKAQDTLALDSVSFVLEKKIDVSCDYFTADELGFIYLVNGDELVKLNPSGDEIFRQSYKSFGDITKVDATQSLRTLLFYRDLTQIVFVDNTLSIQGESIKLEKEGFTFVTLACASFMNNHFWIYSTDEFMIKRLDKQLNEMASSSNLVQLTGKELNPHLLFESGDHVYMCDSLQGILQFDLFGTYIQTIPLKNLKDFSPDQQKILYLENGDIMVYSIRDFSLAKLVLPEKGAVQFKKVKNKLIVSYGNKIEIYQLQPK